MSNKIKITTTPPKGMKPIDVCRACAKLCRPYMKQKFMGPIYYANFMGILDEKCVLFALEKNEIVGFLQWKRYKRDKELLLLNKLAVRTDYLKNGIGTKLMNQFLEKYTENKLIHLGVSKDNSVAISFYEKFGFRKSQSPKNDKVLEMIKLSPKFERFYDL